jgi:hypothetical protein
MEEFLTYYMERNKSKSSHTQTAMRGNLRRLQILLDKPFADISLEDFKNSGEFIAKLTGDYSLSTSISTILAVRALLKYLNAKLAMRTEYDEVLTELVKMRDEEQKNQKKSKEEQEYWIDYPELKTRVETRAKDFLDNKKAFTQYRNFLLLSLYTLIPPTRIGNYLDMKIKSADQMKRDASALKKKFNYIVHLGDGKYRFIFNKYKTAKSVGQIDYTVESDILNKLLHKYFKDYTHQKGIFLHNTDGSPMSQTGVTNGLKSISNKLFDKDMTLNSFRHIYLTHFLSTNPSINEKQKILTLVGHKYVPSTAEKYVRN